MAWAYIFLSYFIQRLMYATVGVWVTAGTGAYRHIDDILKMGADCMRRIWTLMILAVALAGG
jgi:hypothetical protein